MPERINLYMLYKILKKFEKKHLTGCKICANICLVIEGDISVIRHMR